MAGEMEEPFSFKAGSIHSGSISFGRFEIEPLSWERRSSFTHNRFLEEVEKCSTPGSVTQKKAYFEAHFKKKALLHEASGECQNGMEYQTSDDAVWNGDFQDDALPLNDDNSVLNGDLQDNGPSLTNDDEVLDDDLQDVVHSEMHQTQFECNTLPLVKDEPGVKLKDKLADETENVETLQRTSSAPKSRVALKDDSPGLKKSQRQTLKVKATTENKTAKTKLMAQVPRKISSEAPKDTTKNPRREKESLLRTKTEKPSPLKALSPASSLARTSKPEYSENLKAKLSQDNKSEKGLKVKKAHTKSLPSTLEKSEPKASQSANRLRRTINSTKSDVKPSSAIFHFKSDERAVKRKEFHMKLEEKMYAKDAELNQIQAITQEETEAEIKQLRKSLNFKATPMPSFYHEAAPQGSDGKKVVSSHVKSTKSQIKSPSPGCTVAGRSRPSSNAGSQQSISASEFENTAAQPQASEETDCSPTVASEVGESAPSASTSKKLHLKSRKEKQFNGEERYREG